VPNDRLVPRLLFLPQIKTRTYAGNGLDKLYSADFARSIDREHTLEPVRRVRARVRRENTLDAVLYSDTKTWPPDDLLVKADKMTVTDSLELRVLRPRPQGLCMCRCLALEP